MNKKSAALLAVAIALVAYVHTASQRHSVSKSSSDWLASQTTTPATLALANSTPNNGSNPTAPASLPARTMTSESMTMEGLAAQMSTDTNITIDEAMQWIEADQSPEIGSNDQARYIVFTSFFHATDAFTPYIKIYCETEQNGSTRSIKRIISYHLVHVFGSLNKPFAGQIDVFLENPETIHYVVNGDFYEQGITTAQLNVNPDGLMRLTYSITGSANWYAYVYSEQDIRYAEGD
ncbi:hypothetical protein [Paenibacillus wenxiniae]|uniref:Uncharacterized protein n=1 Tax=Paenibacillus wenxiniae TaxID=1636843 RepID=A0ABW4RH32_9BACL